MQNIHDKVTCFQWVCNLPHLLPPQYPVRLYSAWLARRGQPGDIEGASAQKTAGHRGRIEASGLCECALGVHAEFALSQTVDTF